MGQQPPSTTGPQPVGHGVDQLAAVMEGRAATGLGCRDQWDKQLPLGVGQVGWVAAADCCHGGFLVVDGVRTAADHTGFSDTL